MSKLIVHVFLDRNLRHGAREAFRCTLQNELNFSRHIGERIVLADITPDMAPSYVAVGTLDGFFDDGSDGTMVRIAEIAPFQKQVELLHRPPQGEGMSELQDEFFERIVTFATGGFANSAFSHDAVPREAFSQHLRQAQNGMCGFAEVATEHGEAFIIQPLEQGGRWHASNFLFLDPEPAELFATFAWTVGPKFEIIIDSYATGTDIAGTVNRTGMLALSDMTDAWPDRDSLAWHRKAFFERLNR